MNVLIHLNIYHWEEHVAQMVELVLEHIKQGDKVFVTSGVDIFQFCPANKNFYIENCAKCIQQQKYIFKKIIKNVHKLKIQYSNISNFSNLISKIKSSEDFKEIYYDNILPAGKLSLSTLISVKEDVFLNYKDNKILLNNLLEKTIQLYNFSKKLIKNNNINKVYAWNGRRATDGPFLYAAKKMKVPYFAYINAYNYTHFQVQNTLGVHDLNYTRRSINKSYKLRNKNFNNISKRFYEYFRYGKHKMYGKTLFSNQFDNKKITIESKKKILVIFTSSYWEFASLADKEWSKINIYEIIKKIIKDKDIYKQYKIIIRWHPNQKSSKGFERKEIFSIIKEYSDNIEHIEPKSKLNSYSLINISDVVISFGGNIGVEATYYGKPSIIVGTAPYDRLNAVYVAYDLKSLKKLLKLDLKPKKKINSMKYGYYQKTYGNTKFKNLKVGKIGDYYYKNIRLKKINMKFFIKEFVKKLILKCSN